VEAARRYFIAQFEREPEDEDHQFYTLENYPGRRPEPLTPPTLGARVRAIGRQAGRARVLDSPVELSPHLFRRTFATLFYREIRDLKATQLATRHASVDVLMRHYIHAGQGTSRIVARFLG